MNNFWQLRIHCEKDLTLPHPKLKKKTKQKPPIAPKRKGKSQEANSNCEVKEFALAHMNPPFQHPK
jgi:hypothetical protein